MKHQATVNDLTARLKGSALLEIAPYNASEVAVLVASTAGTDAVTWKSVGSIDGLSAEETLEKNEVSGDNAFEENFVSDQMVKLSFNQREAVEEDIRAILRGSFDVAGTPVAGSLVSGYSQVIASGSWLYNKFIPFTYQNGSKAKITPTSVTGGTDGLLAVITDYAIVEQSPGSGIWGIVVEDSAKLTTEAQTITIVYDYTPYASQTIFSGGKTTIPYFMARLTNTDENGKLVRFWFWKCQIDSGYSLAFKDDKDTDPVVANAVSATAYLDESVATAGYQLYKSYQERGIL